jgi:hypothetical protein
MNVTVAVTIGVDVGDVVGELVEGEGVRGEALVDGHVTGVDAVARGGLGLGDEERLRRVNGEDIAGAGAVVVREADAIAAANGGVVVEGIGEAEARSEVVAVGFDEVFTRARTNTGDSSLCSE